ncbi:MAG: hypothetical protein ABII64_02915 [Elusimicrobiota bacterium]
MNKSINKKKVILISVVASAVCFAPILLTAVKPNVTSHFLFYLYIMFISFSILILLVTGSFSIIVISIKKFKKMELGVFEVSALSAGITGAAFVLLLNLMPRPLPTGSDLMKFDPAVWKQESSTKFTDGATLREQMLKDLVENILPGKDKKEIESLLGPSSETDYFKGRKMDYIYYMGPERDHPVMNIDSEWLLIWLDSQGKFRKFKITCD